MSETNPQEHTKSGLVIDRDGAPTESVTVDSADEDWSHTISNFSPVIGDPLAVEGAFYDPKIRRYCKRLSDGTKVIFGMRHAID